MAKLASRNRIILLLGFLCVRKHHGLYFHKNRAEMFYRRSTSDTMSAYLVPTNQTILRLCMAELLD
jgi:hypothetical protein